jgi:hypothetical protein
MADFARANISVRYKTEEWGIYRFKFPISSAIDANDGLLPHGSVIDSVTVRAFIGDVNEDSDLEDFTEISSNLIEPEYVPEIEGDDIVMVKFQYPGEAYKNTQVTLVFEITLDTGGVHPFFFQYVNIGGPE